MTPPATEVVNPAFSAANDPVLGDLRRVLDPADVAARFARRWPGRGHAPSVRACTIEHVRWNPGVDCVAAYRLALTSADAGPGSTVGTIRVDRDGIHHALCTDDAALPGLAAAVDSKLMTRWFSATLGRRVNTCAITVVRHRPGRRCTLRYEVAGRPDVFYGKVFPVDRFPSVAMTLRALDESVLPAIVGFAPGWQLAVQADAGDIRAGGSATDLLANLRAAGRLLSNLHEGRGPDGPQRSLSGDAQRLAEYLPVVSAVDTLGAARFLAGIEQISGRAPGSGAAVPSHGAYRIDQVRLSASGGVLLDLDTYCRAEPARDIGNLLAYLRWRAIRGSATALPLAEARRAFLAGYSEAPGAPPDAERVRAFEASSLLKIAGRRYRRLAFEEWERVPELIGAALEQLRD